MVFLCFVLRPNRYSKTDDHVSQHGILASALLFQATCPVVRCSSFDENGQSSPSPQRTHCVPFAAMLMDPSWHPQSDMDTEPNSRVPLPPGHLLQPCPPFSSWYSSTGQTLQEWLPGSLAYWPNGQGSQATEAPEACADPSSHSLQMNVTPADFENGTNMQKCWLQKYAKMLTWHTQSCPSSIQRSLSLMML